MANRVPSSTPLSFLDDELAAVQQRVERLHSALERCGDCGEAPALRNSLRAAEAERQILRSLHTAQEDDRSISLESIIVQRMNRSLQDASRLSQNWRRGHATPAGYWEAELAREFLGDLLRRFHAWQSAHDDLPHTARDTTVGADGRGGAGQVHPWFIAPEPDEKGHRPPTLTTVEVEALQQTLRQALDDVIDPEHVEIVVEPDGQVIVTGYAHSDEQREETLETVLDTDGVREVVSDLKVVAPDQCPVCGRHGAPPVLGGATTPPQA